MAAMPAVWSLMRPSSSIIEMPLQAYHFALNMQGLKGSADVVGLWVVTPG